MTGQGDYTTGEIMRRLDALVAGQTRLEDRIDHQLAQFVTKEALDLRVRPIEEDVRKGAETVAWFTRAVMALVIAAVIGSVLLGSGAVPL